MAKSYEPWLINGDSSEYVLCKAMYNRGALLGRVHVRDGRLNIVRQKEGDASIAYSSYNYSRKRKKIKISSRLPYDRSVSEYSFVRVKRKLRTKRISEPRSFKF